MNAKSNLKEPKMREREIIKNKTIMWSKIKTMKEDESVRQRKLLGAMGLSVTEDLETVTADINRRNNEAVVSQVHRMPEKANPDETRPRGRKAKKLKDIAEGRRPAVESPKPKGKPGRPKGSKNKKTLLREGRQAKREKRKNKDGT